MDNPRIRAATVKLAETVLVTDNVNTRLANRLLRIIRPGDSQPVEFVGPARQSIKKKYATEISKTNSSKTAELLTALDAALDRLKDLSHDSNLHFYATWLLILEPLTCSIREQSKPRFGALVIKMNDKLEEIKPTPKANVDVVEDAPLESTKSVESDNTEDIWVAKKVELLLIKDLIFIFQGIAGKHIKYDRKSECYIVDPALNLRQSVKDVVYCLCEIGWLYRKVETFLSKLLRTSMDVPKGASIAGGAWQTSISRGVFAVDRRGLVAQAFAYALQEQLQDYFRLLAVLEVELVRTVQATATDFQGLTLLRLRSWMQLPMER